MLDVEKPILGVWYNGPAECTVTSTVERVQQGMSDKRATYPGIGRGTGAVTWVVQPSAPDKLSAIGTTGELWLEGPIVGAGYLNNPDKTNSAFIDDPKWLLNGIPGRIPGRRGRLYRTGDLVYYNPDGTLGFVGRNDTQVKVNGQRMELGEVEFHLRELLPIKTVSQVIVDVITPDATGRQVLAVFLVISEHQSTEIGLKLVIADLRKDLSRLLPSYMVPSVYIPIPLSELPMTATGTGKTDRKGIRGIGRAYIPPTPSSSPLDVSTPDADEPLTTTETSLLDIWARLLNLDPETISPSQTFPDRGGDSIKTMSLAMAIRKHFDITIGVPRLVQHQNTLRELATLIDTLLKGQKVEEPTRMTTSDLEREIGSLVTEIGFSQPAPKAKRTVFLTGSTGFLGTQILRTLLIRRAYDRVVLLVRASDNRTGMDRVVQSAKTAGWWRNTFTSAIEIWTGDLSSTQLGLSEPQWKALCGLPSFHGPTNAIIHNGARVHWATSYEGLRNVNVGSTVQLLQASIHSSALSHFVYASGGLLTDNRVWNEDEAKMANGYDRTKYVSERLVSAAAAQNRHGKNLSVVKPGQIIGDVFTGIANADDFIWRVVMGAVRFGARPVEAPGSWLLVSDVRHVAESTLWNVTGKVANDFVHIKKGVWVHSFWAAVEERLGLSLMAVSWDEWIGLAKRDMMDEKEGHPLWPVQQFLGALGTEVEVTEDDCCEREMGEVLAAVRKNVDWLQDNGYSGTGGGKTSNGKLISRTPNGCAAKLKAGVLNGVCVQVHVEVV